MHGMSVAASKVRVREYATIHSRFAGVCADEMMTLTGLTVFSTIAATPTVMGTTATATLIVPSRWTATECFLELADACCV